MRSEPVTATHRNQYCFSMNTVIDHLIDNGVLL